MEKVEISTPVNPAIFSQLAKAFRAQIVLGTHVKDMLHYHECFQGKQAIDLLARLIGTKDRAIAIIIGRSLGNQGFFHDVTWSSKLRDSSLELYQFEQSPQELPTSVFTLMTDCYSPTCTKNRLCYSLSCPRRFEQQYMISNPGITSPKTNTPDELWSSSVPPEVLQSVTKAEQKRQECIFEIISTEKAFVNDLRNTIQYYMEPLRDSDIFPAEKREQYVKEIFSNMQELYNINSKFLKKLQSRQKENFVVDKIGDIFANVAHEIYPYIEYGAQQIYAKVLLDEERSNNPEFAKFLKTVERMPEFRKLPIDSYLACPTTRLGRYPLLLDAVMKQCPLDHPDRELIPQALVDMRSILTNINTEAGKAKNIVLLRKLHKLVIGNDEDTKMLKLQQEGRQVIREGNVVLKKASDSDLYLFLFDHLLLLTKKKENNYKVYRKPIPLELLQIQKEDLVDQASADAAKSYIFSLSVPNKFGGSFQLQTSTQAERDSWKGSIEKQKLKLEEKKRKFDLYSLVTRGFPRSNPINCCCHYQNQTIIGTDMGLFVNVEKKSSALDLASPKFVKVLDLERIFQVDIIEKIDMLLVLADKTLLSYPLRALLNMVEPSLNGEKLRPKKIASKISFIRQGVCNNETIICAVKTSSLSATIKVLEPVGLGTSNLEGKIGKLFTSRTDTLRQKKRLCVASINGFELVDIENLEMKSILDHNDENLEFLGKMPHVKPISIFRTKDGYFLLCYTEFAFFIDKNGKRARIDWLVQWAGAPVHFSYMHPYIVAYEPSFIEIRDIESGDLQQVIKTNNLRVLSVDPLVKDCVMDFDDPEVDSQHVFRLQSINSYLI